MTKKVKVERKKADQKEHDTMTKKKQPSRNNHQKLIRGIYFYCRNFQRRNDMRDYEIVTALEMAKLIIFGEKIGDKYNLDHQNLSGIEVQ